jgi:hypothetical protein
MAEYERKVTQTSDTGVSESGEVVRERTSKFETVTGPKTTAINFVWYIFGLVGFLLGIRMILKLFGANSANGFVDFIYSVSGVLSAPFDSIFGVTKAEAGTTESVFEPSILVAIAVYALIAWGITKLVSVNEKQ